MWSRGFVADEELGTLRRTGNSTECSAKFRQVEHMVCLRVTMRRVGEAGGSGAVLLIVG